MEFIMELIFELVIAGTFNGATDKKVPMPIRIFSAIVLLLIFGGLIALLAFLGITLIMDGNAVRGSIVLLASGFIMLLFIYAFKKEYIKKRR